MDPTLETLPGEGETKLVKKTRVRRECDECGEPAHYKVTFLLNGCRTNPRSKGYGRDDCSWCEDDCAFACAAHQRKVEISHCPDDMKHCSTFPASERFAHLFLKWEESDIKSTDL